eukprot:7172439-Pyramimonas_sp.AAC.1
MSVSSARLVEPVQPPSENGVAGHLRWLADQLRTERTDGRFALVRHSGRAGRPRDQGQHGPRANPQRDGRP